MLICKGYQTTLNVNPIIYCCICNGLFNSEYFSLHVKFEGYINVVKTRIFALLNKLNKLKSIMFSNSVNSMSVVEEEESISKIIEK